MKELCTKIGILFIMVGVLTSSLIFFPLRQYVRDSVRNALEDTALDVVQKQPGFLDVANIHRLWVSGRYWEEIKSIRRIAESGDVQNIYFIETTRKPWTILWELGYTQEEFLPDIPYQNYLYAYTSDIPADLERAVELRTRIFTAVPYTTKWGTFISLFKPVMARDGKMTGILAVDKEISYDRSLINMSLIISFLPLIVFIVIGALLILSILNRIVRPLLYIKNAVKAIPDAEILDDTQGRKYKSKDNNIGEIVRELSRINELMISGKRRP